MSLIVCPHCGKRVSDTCAVCIHCQGALSHSAPETPQMTAEPQTAEQRAPSYCESPVERAAPAEKPLPSYNSDLTEAQKTALEDEFLQTHPDCKRYYIARHNAAQRFKIMIWPPMLGWIVAVLPLMTGMVYHNFFTLLIWVTVGLELMVFLSTRRKGGVKNELLYLKRYAEWLKSEKGLLYSLPMTAKPKHIAMYNSIDPRTPIR